MPYVNLSSRVKYMLFSKLCGCQSIWSSIMRLHLKKCIQRSFRYFFQIKDILCSSGVMRFSFVAVEKNHTVVPNVIGLYQQLFPHFANGFFFPGILHLSCKLCKPYEEELARKLTFNNTCSGVAQVI